MSHECDYSKEDFLALQQLDLESRGMLCSILSLNGGEHLTVCPQCGRDHFVHEDHCALSMEGKPVGVFHREDQTGNAPA